MGIRLKRISLWMSVSAVIVAADQFSKLWAKNILKAQGTMDFIPGIIGFRYAENTGAAFSALSDSTALLSLISIAVCAAVLVFMIRNSGLSTRFMLPLSMILAGGIGNLIDRLTIGYVIDFLELQFMRFAIFNAADISITVGAAILFIVLLLGGEGIARMDR